jgi:hypothetical protein
MIPSILITIVMYFRSTGILEEKKGDSIVNGLEQTSRVMDTILTDAEYQLTFLTIKHENLAKLIQINRHSNYSDAPLVDDIWTGIYNYCLSNQNILAIYIYLYHPKLMITSFKNRKIIEVTDPSQYYWLRIPVIQENNSSGWLSSYAIPASISESGLAAFFLKKKIQSISLNQPIGEACIAVQEYYIRYKLLDTIRDYRR